MALSSRPQFAPKGSNRLSTSGDLAVAFISLKIKRKLAYRRQGGLGAAGLIAVVGAKNWAKKLRDAVG